MHVSTKLSDTTNTSTMLNKAMRGVESILGYTVPYEVLSDGEQTLILHPEQVNDTLWKVAEKLSEDPSIPDDTDICVESSMVHVAFTKRGLKTFVGE